MIFFLQRLIFVFWTLRKKANLFVHSLMCTFWSALEPCPIRKFSIFLCQISCLINIPVYQNWSLKWFIFTSSDWHDVQGDEIHPILRLIDAFWNVMSQQLMKDWFNFSKTTLCYTFNCSSSDVWTMDVEAYRRILDRCRVNNRTLGKFLYFSLKRKLIPQF